MDKTRAEHLESRREEFLRSVESYNCGEVQAGLDPNSGTLTFYGHGAEEEFHFSEIESFVPRGEAAGPKQAEIDQQRHPRVGVSVMDDNSEQDTEDFADKIVAAVNHFRALGIDPRDPNALDKLRAALQPGADGGERDGS